MMFQMAKEFCGSQGRALGWIAYLMP